MKAKGKDGNWHDWEELTEEERQAWMEAMTEADKIIDYHKTHPRSLSLKDSLLHYEQDHRIC